MQFKMQVLVAAAVMAAAGAANATLTNASNPDTSSLLFVAYDRTAATSAGQASTVIDLGLTFADFTLASGYNTPGTTIVWDFQANSLTINGVAQATTFDWTAAYSTFKNNSQDGETLWGVIAGEDSLTDGDVQQYVTTGAPTAGNIATQTPGNTASMNGALNSLILTHSSLGSHASSANGASTILGTGTGAVHTNSGLGSSVNWRGKLNWRLSVAEGTASDFYFVDAAPIDPSDENSFAKVDKFEGEFLYSGDKLTWTVTAAIPEPSTYAMLLAGVVAVGAVARRRAAK